MVLPLWAATDYIRVNQIGYLTSDTKIATAFANSSLSTLTFSVVQYSTNTVLWGPTAFPSTSTAYLPFSNVYQLDFSSYQPASAVTCYLKLSDGTQSVTFGVGPCVYQNTQETALNFFRAQNCGTGNWYDGGANVNVNCHMPPGTAGFTSDKDGIVVDGPNAGTLIDVEGGWHDSGDWIKFMITTAWVDEVLLFSYQENPTIFQDTLGSNLQPNSPNGVPDILDEARYGLEWIIKMNPNATTFYYDVADGRDHDNFGNLPQNDTESYSTAGVPNEGSGADYGTVASGYRAVYGGAADQGGSNNCARAAGALAMGYQIWSASGTGFQDTTFAGSCLTHAENLYALAKSQNTLITDVDDFYEENDMNPELEMAAVQLYKATGTASYLTDANNYATAAGSADGELDWNQNNFLAHYCLYQVTGSTTLKGYMQADLNADQTTANANTAYSVGYPYVWGTNENLSSLIMMCQLWKKLFPTDTTYDKMATLNRDFILGRNPWGVCFVQGMGTTYPLHPQHNIAMAIYPVIIPGMPIEGPDTYKEYKAQGITLSGTDPYGAFDNNTASGGWCYHDDNQDYVTNEVTSSQACFLINFLSTLSSQCSVVVPTNTATMTATVVKTSTATSTNTVIHTSTSTVTNTVTNSATQTLTNTITQSPTNTVTATQTNTNTVLSNTATSTASATVTPTQTSTSTPLAQTATSTASLTPTSTALATSTQTMTGTETHTSTPLANTATFTMTHTLTPPANTATVTQTHTSTLGNTATATSTNTPVANTATLTSTSTNIFTATSTLTATETNTSTTTPKNTFTRTSTPTVTSSQTFTYTVTPALTNCAGTPAWNGNFVVYRAGQVVGYNGELYQCLQAHTSEPNWMPPAVPALWKDLGPCGSTPTSVASKSTPVVYPNPATGSTTTIQLADPNATSVKVQIFTIAFREVQTITTSQVFGGSLTVSLSDKGGRPLADGLYYFVIQCNGGRWVNKVLVMR